MNDNAREALKRKRELDREARLKQSEAVLRSFIEKPSKDITPETSKKIVEEDDLLDDEMNEFRNQKPTNVKFTPVEIIETAPEEIEMEEPIQKEEIKNINETKETYSDGYKKFLHEKVVPFATQKAKDAVFHCSWLVIVGIFGVSQIWLKNMIQRSRLETVQNQKTELVETHSQKSLVRADPEPHGTFYSETPLF
jgi:hypothetical protein